MASVSNAPDARISNWTMATGTPPGARQVGAAEASRPSRRSAESGA